MAEATNFLEALQADKQTEALANIFNQILEVPEENLNDTSIQMYQNIVTSAFTPRIIETTANNLMNEWTDLQYTKLNVDEQISNLETEFKELINSLHPTENKRRLLNITVDSLMRIFHTAQDKYHNYSFTMNISLEEGAHAPTYAHDTDAAADLYAKDTITLEPHTLATPIHTGLRIALPENWVAHIAPRSSIGAKTPLRLSNELGIIDPAYRGEIMILFDNISDLPYTIQAGDRIAQIWIEPVYRFKTTVVDSLDTTDRGDGGFGSTGR